MLRESFEMGEVVGASGVGEGGGSSELGGTCGAAPAHTGEGGD